MMFTRAAHLGGLLGVSCLFAGCGGGDGSGADTADTKVTAASYLNSRQANSAPPALLAVQSAPAAQADALALGIDAASSQFRNFGASNAIAAPGLTVAYVQMLRDAAAGDTASLLDILFDAPVARSLSAPQVSGVSRQLWAQTGHSFRSGFLSASELASPSGANPFAQWKIAETGFADSSYWFDTQFMQASREIVPPYGITLSNGQNVKLLVADRIDSNVKWPARPLFSGWFVDEQGGLSATQMLRLSDSVRRIKTRDYQADALTSGDGSTLMLIQPAQGTLREFADAKLRDALKDSLLALSTASNLSVTAGEMVLPVTELKLSLPLVQQVERMDRRAVAFVKSSPFDEVNADLRNLDGVGGLYLSSGTDALLNVSSDGLRIRASSWSAFTFSSRNVSVNAGYGGSLGVIVSGGQSWWPGINPEACVPPKPDLRSAFVAYFDAKQSLQWVAAVNAMNLTAQRWRGDNWNCRP